MHRKKIVLWNKRAILMGLLFLLFWNSSGCRTREEPGCKTLMEFVKETISVTLGLEAHTKHFTDRSEENHPEERALESELESRTEEAESSYREFSGEDHSQQENSKGEPSGSESSEQTHSISEGTETEIRDSEMENSKTEKSQIEYSYFGGEETDDSESSGGENPASSSISSSEPAEGFSGAEQSPEPEIPIHQHNFIEKRMVTADAWEEVIYETFRYAVIRCKECGVEFSAAADPQASVVEGVYYSQQMDADFKQIHCSEEHNPQQWYDFYVQREELPVDRIWHEEEYRILWECECGEIRE